MADYNATLRRHPDRFGIQGGFRGREKQGGADRLAQCIPSFAFSVAMPESLTEMTPQKDGCIVREFTFREKDNGNVPDETIFCIFVELNRFRKSLDECSGGLDEWCYSLKHGSTMTEIPDRLKKKPFVQFFRACEIAMFDTDTKLLYEKDMITERDYYNTINTARKAGMSDGMERGLQQGMESGLKKGREEGMLEEQHRIARAMKAKGLSYQMIAELTGLSEDEVTEL